MLVLLMGGTQTIHNFLKNTEFSFPKRDHLFEAFDCPWHGKVHEKTAKLQVSCNLTGSGLQLVNQPNSFLPSFRIYQGGFIF